LSTFPKFRCEVCGLTASNPTHWFVIECGESRLSVMRWSAGSAESKDALHVCGERDAQLYISRWFESQCSPGRPDYSTMPSEPRSAS
jgi:hypothetical protein